MKFRKRRDCLYEYSKQASIISETCGCPTYNPFSMGEGGNSLWDTTGRGRCGTLFRQPSRRGKTDSSCGRFVQEQPSNSEIDFPSYIKHIGGRSWNCKRRKGQDDLANTYPRIQGLTSVLSYHSESIAWAMVSG